MDWIFFSKKYPSSMHGHSKKILNISHLTYDATHLTYGATRLTYDATRLTYLLHS